MRRAVPFIVVLCIFINPGCENTEEPIPLNEPVAIDEINNIWIPPGKDLLKTLRVAAVYNNTHIQLRYEFETDNPHWYHQYWRYENGAWVRYGSGGPAPDPHGLYEDRISMLLDDGSVDGFHRWGGFMTVHDGMRSLTNEVESEEVSAHPFLGEQMGRSDVRKFLPETRHSVDGEDAWADVADEEMINELQEQGVFLDLWQWRAHRSHPVGYADNNYVLHYRLSSEGRGMYTTNWDDDTNAPAWMYDQGKTGFRALDWDRLVNGEYTQEDYYYLSEEIAAPFDPDHEWREGDVIPQRFLREPSGSRGAIRAAGGYSEGAWRVQLTRTLASPDPLDSKELRDGETYNVAFAVHTGGHGARWHLVSLPYTLGLGVEDADITARYVDDDLDNEEVEWHELPVFYPGQVTFQWLRSQEHEGNPFVRFGVSDIHTFHHAEELLDYVIEQELLILDDQ